MDVLSTLAFVTASVVLLVRHAEAEPPDPHLTDDDRPLTDAGRLAAARLTRRLTQRAVRAVYSSPARRALQTVELIASDHSLPVHVMDGLRERQLATQDLPEPAFIEALRQAREDPALALPGGESTNDALARALDALASIRRGSPLGVAVAATHGGLISIVRWHLGQEFSVEDALAEPMPAIYPLRWERGQWRVEAARYV